MPDVTHAPDATPRNQRSESSVAVAADYQALDSAWIRDYFATRIEEIHRQFTERDLRFEQRFQAFGELMEKGEEAYLRQVSSTAEALRIQTSAADSNLMDHIVAQRESVKLALDALEKLLAEKDRAVQVAAGGIAQAQNEFKETMMVRLEILNDHKNQVTGILASTVHKEQFQELRDQIILIDARSSDNARNIASLATNPADQTAMRLRLDAVESRPVPLTAEEQGEIRAQIVETKRDVDRMRTDNHDLRNTVQQLKLTPTQFGTNEVEDIRRLLRAAIRADVTEWMTDAELKATRRLIEGKGTLTRRFISLETALITGVISVFIAVIVLLITRHLG